MEKRVGVLALVLALSSLVLIGLASVAQDPLVRMPGTQPSPEGNVSLESPNRCLNCHAGYNTAVEPGFNWKGSMMAQAARDPLFWTCLTVAAQDSKWAVGSGDATDLCLRCHLPKGWLEGRSDPSNGSAMIDADFDGVQCDFCHRMYDPFHEEAYSGTREGSDWLNYWDETNASSSPSQPAADAGLAEDRAQAATVRLFNGGPFFPLAPAYLENGSGQYFVSSQAAKRGPFADAAARHQMLYSRYHKSKYFCSSCHDVSNPVLANSGADPNLPLPTETSSAYSYYHVERTFSEFMLSAYGRGGGAAGKGPFSPAVFETSLPNNLISRCQDCHMRDVTGAGADKNGAPTRPGGSVEHPQSGEPLHDLTGGNVWVSRILASTVPGSPNYDPVNDSLLNQGPAALTMDLQAGQGIDSLALLAGADRALQQLTLAAAIENVVFDPLSGEISFRIQNQTGHKLISGFPEGRRMFVNIRGYRSGSLVYEVNPYDPEAGTLKGLEYNYRTGLDVPPPASLNAGVESYQDDLVFEMRPASSLTGEEEESFHFVLADSRHKDNRIPPQGFDWAAAATRLAQPRWDGRDAPAMFSEAEYAGGYKEVSLAAGALVGADYVEVNLYYQTTSREYMEFLRDEITAPANYGTLPREAYVIASDPFFDQLRAWGNTMWQLWTHNLDAPGAAPVLMAAGNWGTPPTPACIAPGVPSNLMATGGRRSVGLEWVAGSPPPDGGYVVYYDQGGKTQLVSSVGAGTMSFDDKRLSRDAEYCYVVTAWNDCDGDGQWTAGADMESGPSSIACAIAK